MAVMSMTSNVRSRFITVAAAILAIAVLAFSAAAHAAPAGLPDLVERLSPAVVNVSSSQGSGARGGGAVDQGRRKLNPPAVSLGSGFVIDPAGVVVTNNHVIDNAEEITITLNDGREFKGTVRARDRETDLAVVQIDAKGQRLPYVEFGDSAGARVGEDVFAIGNPFGLGGTVTRGIISARNRDIDAGSFDDFIQTDAAINRGNSGGPLFDFDGKVIGVNTAIYSQTGGSVGVGFAVPADLAEIVVDQLLRFGETRRGWLGVSIDEVTPKLARQLGFERPRGAVVTLVRPNSPALNAGLQPNDVILEFNKRQINSVRDLTRGVAETPIGRTVPLLVLREGKRLRLRVTVDRRETNILAALPAGPLPEGAVQSSGLTLQKPTRELSNMFGFEPDVAGVVVTAVDPDSPAAIVLKPGDIILEIGWERITRPDAAAAKLEKLRNLNSGPVFIIVQRGDIVMTESLRP